MVTTGEHGGTVREGYDRVAESYLAQRDQWKSTLHLDRLLTHLEPRARILDAGCGAGVPVDSYLAANGCQVVGIDISPKQIELAERNVPSAVFEIRDMQDLDDGEYDVDAVISFYAIFHTPRETHAETLRRFATFLRAGGLLLITMASSEWEGEEDFYGAPMWWSHYGAEKNRKLVESAGFEVLSEEIVDEGDERHQLLLARKR